MVALSRSRLLGLLLVLLLRPLAGGEPVDLLLIAADDATLQPLLAKVTSPKSATHAAWTFWTGTLSGKSVVLARSEGDPLNAVAATTLAIRLHSPRLIVTYGSARAHDPALKAGDVVVSEAFAAIDGMISRPTPGGDGSQPLRWTKRAHPLAAPGEADSRAESFPASAAAVTVALRLPAPGGRVVSGVLGSAHQVNREADRIAWLRAQWRTSTEDGESGHIAACASLFGVPVVGFRVVEGQPGTAAAFALAFVEAWK